MESSLLTLAKFGQTGTGKTSVRIQVKGVDRSRKKCGLRKCKKKEVPQQLGRESLEKLAPDKLVDMVLKLQELVLK